MAKFTWTTERDEQLRELWGDKRFTAKDVARKLKCSEWAVYARALDLSLGDVPLKWQERVTERRERLARMRTKRQALTPAQKAARQRAKKARKPATAAPVVVAAPTAQPGVMGALTAAYEALRDLPVADQERVLDALAILFHRTPAAAEQAAA